MKRLLFLFVVMVIALGLRMYAAPRLDVDYDEPVYLGNALEYTGFLRESRFNMLAWNDTTYEHPALYKIVYGLALLSQPPLDKLQEKDLKRQVPIDSAPAKDWNMVGRYVSVVFGTLSALALSLIAPAAGLVLAVSSICIKYTSEFYLEALPLLTSLLCGLFYLNWFRILETETTNTNRGFVWLGASALCLGLTAAGKYVYCIVGLAIVIHFCMAVVSRKELLRSFPYLIAWGMVALLTFFLFNPYLWPHPIERLIQSVTFHMEYKDSLFVKSYQYPFWQSYYWLSAFTNYYGFRPQSALLVNLDTPIFLLACLGVVRLFVRQRFFFYWLVLGLAMLFLWTTKWPQYTLIILVPFSISAGEGISLLLELSKREIKNRRKSVHEF